MLKPFHRNDLTRLLNCNDHLRPIVVLRGTAIARRIEFAVLSLNCTNCGQVAVDTMSTVIALVPQPVANAQNGKVQFRRGPLNQQPIGLMSIFERTPPECGAMSPVSRRLGGGTNA